MYETTTEHWLFQLNWIISFFIIKKLPFHARIMGTFYIKIQPRFLNIIECTIYFVTRVTRSLDVSKWSCKFVREQYSMVTMSPCCGSSLTLHYAKQSLWQTWQNWCGIYSVIRTTIKMFWLCFLVIISGNYRTSCFGNLMFCPLGATWTFWLKLGSVKSSGFYLSSGGQTPDSIGIAIYR